MSKDVHKLVLKTETFVLSHGKDGYWLYDYTRRCNLAMRAKTEHEAFTETIKYYQEYLTKAEQCYESLSARVDAFVNSFVDDDNE